MIINKKMRNCVCINCECRTRSTKQRKMILEKLCSSHIHPTAEEIHTSVKKIMPEISLATVYRNLDFLEKEGKVKKLKHKGENGKTRYDGFMHLHYHLICKDCGTIVDIDDCNCILMKEKELSKKYGFSVELDAIEIMGICKNCKKQRINKPKNEKIPM